MAVSRDELIADFSDYTTDYFWWRIDFQILRCAYNTRFLNVLEFAVHQQPNVTEPYKEIVKACQKFTWNTFSFTYDGIRLNNWKPSGTGGTNQDTYLKSLDVDSITEGRAQELLVGYFNAFTIPYLYPIVTAILAGRNTDNFNADDVANVTVLIERDAIMEAYYLSQTYPNEDNGSKILEKYPRQIVENLVNFSYLNPDGTLGFFAEIEINQYVDLGQWRPPNVTDGDSLANALKSNIVYFFEIESQNIGWPAIRLDKQSPPTGTTGDDLLLQYYKLYIFPPKELNLTPYVRERVPFVATRINFARWSKNRDADGAEQPDPLLYVPTGKLQGIAFDPVGRTMSFLVAGEGSVNVVLDTSTTIVQWGETLPAITADSNLFVVRGNYNTSNTRPGLHFVNRQTNEWELVSDFTRGSNFPPQKKIVHMMENSTTHQDGMYYWVPEEEQWVLAT